MTTFMVLIDSNDWPDRACAGILRSDNGFGVSRVTFEPFETAVKELGLRLTSRMERYKS
jgi:hypothetical protein